MRSAVKDALKKKDLRYALIVFNPSFGFAGTGRAEPLCISLAAWPLGHGNTSSILLDAISTFSFPVL